MWKIREKLRQASLSRVDVGTVEDYQGREKRVVIISCVRSSARFLKEDGQKGIGLVFEKKRCVRCSVFCFLSSILTSDLQNERWYNPRKRTFGHHW